MAPGNTQYAPEHRGGNRQPGDDKGQDSQGKAHQCLQVLPLRVAL